MRKLPRDPYAFQARVFDALLGDIRDPQAKSFPRLDALRETLSQTTRDGSASNKPLPRNS